MVEQTVVDIILRLYDLGGIKISTRNEFQLKSGLFSPVYFDLRLMGSDPQLLKQMSSVMWSKFAQLKKEKPALICGVPYTGLLLVPLISINENIPIIVIRKERKQHGTKKLIEGIFHEGQNCLLIEDVISSGGSVIETAKELKKEGLEITDVVVFLDRGQGGDVNLENNGIAAHSVVSCADVLSVLHSAGKITQEEKEKMEWFLKGHQLPLQIERPNSVVQMTLETRKSKSESTVAEKLFDVMLTKKTNLCLAADVTTFQDLTDLIGKVGPKICCLKTHVDLLIDWTDQVKEELVKLAKEHKFLLFEDRKFADIGKTVSGQLHQGIYHISQWADLVTVHGLPGPGILDSLEGKCKALIVAEMSSKGNLADSNYASKCTQMAVSHKDAIGVVSQSRLNDDKPDFVQMTPGVQIKGVDDKYGQQYISPEDAILHRGADVIIVGRGISASTDPAEAAERYRDLGWKALLSRFSKLP